MNLNHRIRKIGQGLLKFLQLQLFITLISFPILISWGLPISLLSPIGNLVFAPVLTAFLLLSSLIFFTTLLHIPNGLLCICMEKITEWWLWSMSCANQTWLYGFAKPPWWVIITIPICALLLLHFRYIKSTIVSIVCFLALLIASCLYIRSVHSNHSHIETIACNKGAVTMIHHANNVIIIDPGVIGQSIAAPTWVEYTLMPAIIKTTGKTCIDHLVLLQPNQMVFSAIALLAQKLEIRNVYLPYWDGTLTKREWRYFFECKESLQKNNGILHRIAQKPYSIHVTKTAGIHIEPIDQTITHKEITYPAIHVSGQVDDTLLSIHSYKYKKKTV